LAGEIDTAMQSLNALTEEAGAVVAQQEEAGEEQQQLAAALQEVKERKDKKQEEVRPACAFPFCKTCMLMVYCDGHTGAQGQEAGGDEGAGSEACMPCFQL
jgi:hypothetical protein